MWPIKIFGLSQGFLISTLLGNQNEFCVFRNQKTPFSPNNTKKRKCSLSFKLGHVTYQNIRLESRIPNIHFTWLSKWVLCLSQPKNAISPNNAKKRYCSLSFKLGHVTYQNIQTDPRIPNIHLTWLSKWVLCLSQPKNAFFHQITAKNGIVSCHSNWVMWPIKIFGWSQGFLITTLLGYQNEFCVFCNQKTPFSLNNAKKRYCSLSFKLGHVTYQNIRLESKIPNIHFTWLSKWVLCLSQPKNAFFTK
jgi:hypothetical protein